MKKIIRKNWIVTIILEGKEVQKSFFTGKSAMAHIAEMYLKNGSSIERVTILQKRPGKIDYEWAYFLG